MKYAIKRFYKNEPDHNLKEAVAVLFEYDENEKHFCTRMRIVASESNCYELKFERVQITSGDILFIADSDSTAIIMYNKLKNFVE